MKKWTLVILLISFSVIGCSQTEGPSTDPVLFQVKIDSISHPSSVALGDTADIRFFGVVGPDGCDSFSHFLVIRQPASVDFAVWGKRSQANACPAVMVYLDGNSYGYIPSQQGMLQISIHQPDGSTLKDSLLVE